MNTILQKRIEKAAMRYAESEVAKMDNSSYSMHERKRLKMFDGYDIEEALTTFAEKVLQNQWISVEEALPPYDDRLKEISIDVIVRNEYGKATSAWYDYANKVWHLLYGEIAGDDVLDSKITHWAEIPKFNK